MSCPEGQFYAGEKKGCLPLRYKPMSKGKSLLPCPDGQVWNPDSDVRRCVRKNMYKLAYGEERVRAASRRQKELRATGTKKNKKGPISIPIAKVVVVPSFRKNAITPALKRESVIESAEMRRDSVMPPGLMREDMAKWVSSRCKNLEDPIMMEPYADAELKDLRSLLRLGSGFCYSADVLDTHVRSSIERNVPVKDMLNPSYRLDAQDYGALLTAGRQLKKGYKLPSLPSEKPASHYKLFIGVSGEPDFKMVFLFDERKVIKLEKGARDFTKAIPDGGWIGWIPAKGTAALEKLIESAFEKGRIFTKAERPFRCCRIHLKKDKSYWSQDKEKKINMLEEELRGLL
jgi:hypothetical protein